MCAVNIELYVIIIVMWKDVVTRNRYGYCMEIKTYFNTGISLKI